MLATPAPPAFALARSPTPQFLSLRSHPAITAHAWIDGLFRSSSLPLPPEDGVGQLLRESLEASGLPAQRVFAAAIPGQGRGLVASSSIRAGQTVLQVPGSLLITPHRALQELQQCQLLTATDVLPDWSVLALWLAALLAQQPAHEGEAPGWKEVYASVLPGRQQCCSVLGWSLQEVAWLQGSHLHTIATEIRSAAAASWEELQPVIQRAEHAGLVPPGALCREALRHAFDLLLSRLVRLDGRDALGAASSGGSVDALCPWADLINHDCSCTSFLQWDAASAAVVLRADRAYASAEQVIGSYGQKSSGQLLLSYGFCPAEGSNPQEACLLPLDAAALSATEDQGRWKAHALNRRGLPPAQLFPLRMNALPDGMLCFAAFASAAVAGEEEAETLCRRLYGGAEGGAARQQPCSNVDMPAELLLPALEVVTAASQAAASAYVVDLNGGRAELAELQQSGRGGGRRAQVLLVLLQEQRVLSRAAFLLRSQARELRRAQRAVLR